MGITGDELADEDVSQVWPENTQRRIARRLKVSRDEEKRDGGRGDGSGEGKDFMR